MSDKYAVGQDVYYSPPVKLSAARGTHKITARLPVESDERFNYRLKSATEAFERTADEAELSVAEGPSTGARLAAACYSLVWSAAKAMANPNAIPIK
jgi:hypothetical protein